MRIQVNINSQNPIIIPKSHNHILQGLIYTLLDPALRRFLHNEGYIYEKRNFKLFTYSRLIGKFTMGEENFEFSPPVKLIISSPKNEILQSLCEGLLKKDNLSLNGNNVFIESISVLPKQAFGEEITIKMLSPMTVYSTLNKPDGSKKTYYYSPFEKEFNALVRENLRKKYFAYLNKELKDFDFKITPYKVRNSNEKVIIYKGFVIKAWMGLYKLEGDPKIIELAYDTGLGSKNSQGFGCWEMYTR